MRILEIDTAIKVMSERILDQDWERLNYSYKSKFMAAYRCLLDAKEALE